MLPLTAFEGADRATFRLWAPSAQRVELVLFAGEHTERVRLGMERGDHGVHSISLGNVGPHVLYEFVADGRGPFPDPFARSLPFGVHGPAELVREAFEWTDGDWRGVAPERLVIMEVHVGAATPEGTFDALISHLQHWRELGVTAIELLPVASCAGRWNWGYDGVQLFAPSRHYGGPAALCRLVDAAHAKGIAVLLDVVFNHLGPEGNYLSVFAPEAFVRDRPTPWGDTLDLSRRVVRDVVIENAAYWVREFHVDGLRLDATHALSHDDLLQDLASRARAAAPHRRVVVIAEDDRNESRLVAPPAEGGCGLDAVWADDFHHQLRVALTGEGESWLADYSGEAADVARTLQDGWFYRGQHSAHRGRARGTTPPSPLHCVHALQNHDQIGNRAEGDRLGARIDDATYRAAAALLLLTPGTPLLFMGQEWNATTPFQFFTDFAGELGHSVTLGRRREFAAFTAFAGALPDPQDEATFRRSKLDWEEVTRAPHRGILAWHRFLVALRQEHIATQQRDCRAEAVGPRTLRVTHRRGRRTLDLWVSFDAVEVELPPGARLVATSDAPRFDGRGGIHVEGSRARFTGPGALVCTRERA